MLSDDPEAPDDSTQNFAPKPGWSLKSEYSKELKKMFPDAGKVFVLRKMIFEGPEMASQRIQSNLQTIILLTALVLGGAVSSLSIQFPELCTLSDGLASQCDLQLAVASIDVVLALVLIIWCMIVIGSLRFTAKDELAYKITINIWKFTGFPVGMLVFVLGCLGFCMCLRVALQLAKYDESRYVFDESEETDKKCLVVRASDGTPTFVVPPGYTADARCAPRAGPFAYTESFIMIVSFMVILPTVSLGFLGLDAWESMKIRKKRDLPNGELDPFFREEIEEPPSSASPSEKAAPARGSSLDRVTS